MAENMNMKEGIKFYNNVISEARRDSKLDYCLLCKKRTRICNSHSLPSFILRNIENNGYVYTSNVYFRMPFIENKSGNKRSGTFRRICKECDNSFFNEYENDELLKLPLNDLCMTQIDLKNSLRMYDKRLVEAQLYNSYVSKYGTYSIGKLAKEILENIELDRHEIDNNILSDSLAIKKVSPIPFNLMYWNKLPYVSSIAFQGHIALAGDLEGNLINDIYNKNKNYNIQLLNICIFPLKSETIVAMFLKKDNERYRNFARQFKKLKKKDKLRLISFIVCNYSEDFFMSEKIDDTILNSSTIGKVVKNTAIIAENNAERAREQKIAKREELLGYKNFPNYWEGNMLFVKVMIDIIVKMCY